jgi:prephenate dehydrogenase
MTQKIMIAGLGLIGASLAKCIKKAVADSYLIGWDHCESTNALALRRKVVDVVPSSFAEGATEAEIIVLALPVEITKTYLAELGNLSLKPNVLVTDTGSTKAEIVQFAQQFSFDFIGGHPMAGSHKSGILAADENLFENAYYIFTPTTCQRINELQQLFQGTRAKYVELTPTEHDQITGMLSHLPHIIASGLVNQANGFNQSQPRAQQLAAGGFRDITRIASSDPRMWTDILLSNRRELLQLIAEWQNQMAHVSQWLQAEDEAAIFQFFESAKETRDHLPVHQNGAIPAFYDLMIDVPDHPGVVAEVTQLLSTDNLSLINLKILETREDIMGVLQLTFKNQHDLQQAQQLITEKTTYQCRIK